MIWDSCLCRAVAQELTDALGGQRARAVTLDRGAQRVSVQFRESTWVTDLSPGGGWSTLDPPTDPPEDARPLPAVLSSVETLPDERVLRARFRRIRGSRPHPSLILELTTNRWNAVWTEGSEDRVVARLRVDPRRPHPVGQPWQAPEPSKRQGIDRELREGVLEELLARPEADRRRGLLQSLAHLSSLNVGEILEAASPAEARERWRRLALLTDPSPGLSAGDQGPQPYPWPLLHARSFQPTASVLDAMKMLSEARPTAAADPLRKALGDRRAYLIKRSRRLEEQIAGSDRAAGWRDRATLILANLHAIPAGASEVTVTGLTGEPETLRLDPARRPQDQAEALFKRAGRLERALATLPQDLADIRRELEELGAWEERIDAGEATDSDRARLRERYVRGEGGSRESEGPAEPFRRYRSSGGIEIWVGRNSRRNDELTFRHARPADVWLHARHASGAHVVLRWEKDERPPRRDLEEAAILAALHSKARGSGPGAGGLDPPEVRAKTQGRPQGYRAHRASRDPLRHP